MGISMYIRTKRVGDKIVALAAFAILLSISVIPALASNWKDTAYTFNFENSTWQTTEMRVKEDDSYVYMNCQYSEYSGDTYNAYVWGWNSDTNTRFETGGPYSFWEGKVRKMTNYVYENDGDYAYIRAEYSGDHSDGYFKGLWSPDSI